MIDIWFIQEIRFVSQEQFNYINKILKQHNAQLRMHHFEDLTGFLIHSPHAKLKFKIKTMTIITQHILKVVLASWILR